MAKTKGALKILDRVTGNSDSIKAGIAAARANLEVAHMTYDARTKAGLSQSEIAALIGSKQPVIARLEDADYERSLSDRVAAHRGGARTARGTAIRPAETTRDIQAQGAGS